MALEDSLASWAKPPGSTEQDKCDNAVRGIRKAIDGSTKLASKTISVFALGSYCNRTNVRQDMRHLLSAIYANAEFLGRRDRSASTRAELLLEIQEAVLRMRSALIHSCNSAGADETIR
jgi:hypothetical protein